MNNFKLLYRILKALERAMDVEEFDVNLISPKQLGISRERWICYITMLLEEGLVKDALVIETLGDKTEVIVDHIKITLKGLQYLEENSLMKKVAELAKGIADVVK